MMIDDVPGGFLTFTSLRPYIKFRIYYIFSICDIVCTYPYENSSRKQLFEMKFHIENSKYSHERYEEEKTNKR